MKRNIFLYLFFLFFLWIFLSGCARKKHENVLITDQQNKEYPSQEGWNSEIILSRAGLCQAVIHYAHMVKYDKKKVVFFDGGVEVDFYDKNGNHTSHLTSEKGEYHEATEDVVGLGNVVVVSDSGVTLRTEVLRWDNRREKIFSDTTVMITTEKHDTLYGVGFESNADLSHRVIYKPWGITDKKINIQELEASFSQSSRNDTLARKDSTVIEKK